MKKIKIKNFLVINNYVLLLYDFNHKKNFILYKAKNKIFREMIAKCYHIEKRKLTLLSSWSLSAEKSGHPANVDENEFAHFLDGCQKRKNNRLK